MLVEIISHSQLRQGAKSLGSYWIKVLLALLLVLDLQLNLKYGGYFFMNLCCLILEIISGKKR
jgi:hypothetical protein